MYRAERVLRKQTQTEGTELTEPRPGQAANLERKNEWGLKQKQEWGVA